MSERAHQSNMNSTLRARQKQVSFFRVVVWCLVFNLIKFGFTSRTPIVGDETFLNKNDFISTETRTRNV